MADEPGNILVVDDDQALLQIFGTVLAREGYQVKTAETGAEGLRLALAAPFDVVLLDIHLPDMSGIEILRQIVPATDAAVILITGDDVNYSYESALHEGATDFILKPVRLPELFRRILQARQSRARAADKERQIANLARLAIHDELTGLFNRRHFQERLQMEIQRAQRYGQNLSLGMFDVDLFKQINDTQGHAEGDRVLVGLGQVLRSVIRATDEAYRFGGDEIAILIPETTGPHALIMAEKILRTVAATDILDGHRVTLSGGIAEYRPAEEPSAFLQRADAALYAAKRAGRNRVVLG